MTIDVTEPTEQDGLSLQELTLYHEIMAYRASLGLAALPLSNALTITAGRHVADTRENIWAENVTLPDGANLHSWSDAYYYSDHRDPTPMWTAPARVGTDYPTSGYEISAAGFSTTAAALEGWIGSPSHNAILTGTGVWEGIELRAIGIGVDTSPGAGVYAGRIFHVWFGETLDAATPVISGTVDADIVIGTAFADRIVGLSGDDDISGDAGDDYLAGSSGDDRLRGDAGDDTLSGGAGDDLLWGGIGNDTLRAGSGADRIWGGDGDDAIFGGGGSDFIVGGAGQDTLTGNGGANSFVFNSIADSPPGAGQRDVITDFVVGLDRIELGWIDAVSATEGNDAFAFIGARGFSGTAGELRFAGGLVEADVDGDALADMQIELIGIDALSDSDFLL